MRKTNCTVITDPRVAYNYATYYIEGLRRSGIPLTFRIKEFQDIRYQHYPNQGIPLLIKRDGRDFHVFIDFHDTCLIDEAWYQWCHVYAKVNVSFGDEDKYEKLMVLGPSFGIDLQNNIVSDFILGLRNYYKGGGVQEYPLRNI